jgi:hypothetical protein
MSTHIHTTVRAAAIAALLAAAPAAQSEMYRWIDSQGSVTYSNQLPHDMSVVRDLTVILGDPDKQASDLARVEPRAGTAGSLPLTEPPQSSPRIAIAPGAPDAVRDPCLRSPDPKCIERNKGAYIPYHGYSPSPAVGATASAGAGGALAGGSSPPGKLTAPKASVYALPPGSEGPLPRTAAKH